MPIPEVFRRFSHRKESFLTDVEKAEWNAIFAEVPEGSIFMLSFEYWPGRFRHEAVKKHYGGWRYFGPGGRIPMDELVELQELKTIELLWEYPG